jgi:hypothetical protein
LARLVPARNPDRFHSARSDTPGDETGREMDGARRGIAGLARARGVGRRLVSMRSPNPGPCSRAPRRRNGRRERWPRSNAS